MPSNLKLVVDNYNNKLEERQFFERDELKVILDLYAKMVSEGSWKDYGLSISSKQVSFSVFRNAAENALYKMKQKKLDAIILNTANNYNQGFDVDTNQITIYQSSGSKFISEIDTKDRIANFIWEKLLTSI